MTNGQEPLSPATGELPMSMPMAPMSMGITATGDSGGPPHLPEDFGVTTALPMTIGEIKARLEEAPAAKVRFETALVRRRLFGIWAQEANSNVARSVWLELLKEML